MYKKLFKYFQKINNPLLLNLKSGLSIEQINALEKKYNIHISNSLREFYQLYNGFDEDSYNYEEESEIYLFPGAILHSLEEAISSLNENINSGYKYVEKYLFPFAYDGRGSLFLIQTNQKAKDFDKIYYYKPGAVDFNKIISIYDSEETMVNSIIECFEKGAYIINGNIIDFNKKLELEICSILNPLSEYWKLYKDTI